MTNEEREQIKIAAIWFFAGSLQMYIGMAIVGSGILP